MCKKSNLLLSACGAIFLGLLVQIGYADVKFHAPEPYVTETLYKEAKVACPAPQDWPCFEKKLFEYARKYGPQGPIETFTLLQTRGDISPTIDAHHVVHHIGHHTAMAFGSNSQSFALCPTSYNYGCLHGFFQHALGMGGTTEEAAAKICEDVENDPNVLGKTKFSCYHGLGHGVMMFEDHDLMKSLKVCDSFKSAVGQQGCWQGVFMENVDVAEEGHWKKGLFSKEDPLAPCNKLAEKYRHECFINHSGWLMTFYHNDLGKAAQACAKAPGNSSTTCLETLGLLITNSAWQSALLPGSDPTQFVENAWTLCKKFPEGHVGQCVNSALDNLMNSNTVGPDTMLRAGQFCQIVDLPYREPCYRQVANDLRYLTPNLKAAHDHCKRLKDKKGRKVCLSVIGPI